MICLRWQILWYSLEMKDEIQLGCDKEMWSRVISMKCFRAHSDVSLTIMGDVKIEWIDKWNLEWMYHIWEMCRQKGKCSNWRWQAQSRKMWIACTEKFIFLLDGLLNMVWFGAKQLFKVMSLNWRVVGYINTRCIGINCFPLNGHQTEKISI